LPRDPLFVNGHRKDEARPVFVPDVLVLCRGVYWENGDDEKDMRET